MWKSTKLWSMDVAEKNTDRMFRPQRPLSAASKTVLAADKGLRANKSTRAKQELNKSEMNRDKVSAELRVYRNINMESRVSGFKNGNVCIYLYWLICTLLLLLYHNRLVIIFVVYCV